MCGFLLVLLPFPVFATVLKSDTTWSGTVFITDDILVSEGVTLTIEPGTKIRVIPAESTKTDPEYVSSLTEITVRGSLIANGEKASPVEFLVEGEKRSAWAGIIVDGGKAVLDSTIISDAETGVYVLRGSLVMSGSLLKQNRYGITVQGHEAVARVTTTRVEDNDYGVFLLNGAKIESTENIIKENRKKDRFTSAAKDYHLQEREYSAGPENRGKSRVYADEAMLGMTVWQGRIQVNGIIRVPENSRLIILPGTVIEFSRKDTNKDGIGENGLLVQGSIIAKGTKENPIIFRSSEKQGKMGDWDSINILNSDKGQNLIEYCQIEDAYRGLHFHFSNVAVADSVLRNNYRGMQFQESVVEIRGTWFYRNKSAFQARDSEIIFSDNVIYHNYAGMNIFRNSITLRGTLIVNNYLEGMRVREGLPIVDRNFIDGNRHGVMVSDAFYGEYKDNVISHNLESGMSLKGTESVEISGNVIQGNGINGMNIQDSSGAIQGNLITDNAERGIGVLSFQGVITGNNVLRNGLYNLGIDGATDVSARMNWWGGGDVRATIYDKEKDPSKGRADYLPMLDKPIAFTWPLNRLSADTKWYGDVVIKETISVDPGVNLVISPKSRVLFSEGAGIAAKGKILARGEKDAGISFTSFQGQGPDIWQEILLDHATGSEFLNCLFENATWALHIHFTDITIENCTFRNNGGGLRFTSGPIEIRHSLFEKNGIGIRAFRGTALITGNVLTGNGTGIFVREKGSGLTITKNNLFANSEYNVRLGDFNDEDVHAIKNWWGTLIPADTIYDARREPGIGTVLYEPFEQQPFSIEFSPDTSMGQVRQSGERGVTGK